MKQRVRIALVVARRACPCAPAALPEPDASGRAADRLVVKFADEARVRVRGPCWSRSRARTSRRRSRCCAGSGTRHPRARSSATSRRWTPRGPRPSRAPAATSRPQRVRRVRRRPGTPRTPRGCAARPGAGRGGLPPRAAAAPADRHPAPDTRRRIGLSSTSIRHRPASTPSTPGRARAARASTSSSPTSSTAGAPATRTSTARSRPSAAGRRAPSTSSTGPPSWGNCSRGATATGRPASSHQATPRFATDLPNGGSYSVAAAIDCATDFMAPGDVMLVEAQTYGPRDHDGDGTNDFVPVEWDQAEYDAIKIATAAGIVVVEPAGNGGEDLDDAVFGGKFNRSTRDSGRDHRRRRLDDLRPAARPLADGLLHLRLARRHPGLGRRRRLDRVRGLLRRRRRSQPVLHLHLQRNERGQPDGGGRGGRDPGGAEGLRRPAARSGGRARPAGADRHRGGRGALPRAHRPAAEPARGAGTRGQRQRRRQLRRVRRGLRRRAGRHLPECPRDQRRARQPVPGKRRLRRHRRDLRRLGVPQQERPHGVLLDRPVRSDEVPGRALREPALHVGLHQVGRDRDEDQRHGQARQPGRSSST